MLIAIMGTTYERVIENEKRSTLQMKTNLLANYVYLCSLDKTKLSKHRYLYIAMRSTKQKEQVQDLVI